MTNVSSTSSRVLWIQVWGLAAVQGAIALTWVIYNLYLRDLLTDFGFPLALATTLLILENLLGAVMEPLMGNFSDQAQRWVGSRFPFIAVGIILASICFILIPTIFVFGARSGAVRWLLPIILVAWAIAMTVFRSPALSLLGRYAFATNLPQAASILTLVGGLAGAMGPLANTFILGLGPMVTFAVGSVVLLAAAAALRSVSPNRTIHVDDNEGDRPKISQDELDYQDLDTLTQQTKITSGISIPALALVFGSGVGVGLGFRLMMQNFPKVLAGQDLGNSQGIILGLIFLSLACTAIPAGSVATRLGNRVSMFTGLWIMALLCGLMVLTRGAVLASVIAIALGASFSMVSNGTIPFALSMVPPEKVGLGTGIYFSGGAIANSVFGMFFSAPDALTAEQGSIFGAIAFLLAGLCVAMSVKLRPIQPT